MADCCENKSCAIDVLRVRQSSTLKVVLCINVVMFLVEIVAGIMSGSTALLSDSLDNLGDAITYGLSLYAIASAPRSKAKIALFKGILILIAGLFVFSQVVYRIIVPIVPIYETMGLISLLALLANGTCLALLWKRHEEDINMSSVWECSRNDVASNISVFVAAGGVWLTHSGWPDILVGLLLALLFLKSSVKVIRGAVSELRNL
ncbi:cation diffusion facilitator family transporter [Methylotenera sp.]|uniref:cation diffusion facilitator family transporter n=1 Tax=Methylotenera sp. TaxID=2051956 RepID=UPI002731F261|nr:cation diffusion facilitator family transporter [Methylotenera sp.]MDP2231134.1 cation diffusion facilitator family transporter [Methylotenera sp.]MDP3142030.1 cation diffusion facilitator family transporter [Methylotenera sp.]